MRAMWQPNDIQMDMHKSPSHRLKKWCASIMMPKMKKATILAGDGDLIEVKR